MSKTTEALRRRAQFDLMRLLYRLGLDSVDPLVKLTDTLKRRPPK